MFTMKYTDNFPFIDCNIEINISDDDISLTPLFAYFILMTDKIGYQPGSWNNTIEDIKNILDQGYDAEEWAESIIADYIIK